LLEPVAEMGTSPDEPLQQFDQIRGATRLSNGEIVVATSSPPLLRWYDSNGVYVRGAGTYGEGPGEFVGRPGVFALWRDDGDTIGVWERPRQAVHLFDPDGRYVRTVAVTPPVATFPTVVARLADGGFLAYTTSDPVPRDSGSVAIGTLDFWLLSEDGTLTEILAGLPRSTEVLAAVNEREVWRSYPFAAVSAFDAMDNEIYYGFPSTFRIDVYDTVGSLKRSIRRSEGDRVLTGDIIDGYKASRVADAPAGSEADWRRALDQEFYPELFPAFRTIRKDRVGHLWVQAYPIPGRDSVPWSVFDQSGSWIADLNLPSGFDVHEIGPDWILGSAQNDLDVERIVLLGLKRGSQ
jgi:hypothetical protein